MDETGEQGKRGTGNRETGTLGKDERRRSRKNAMVYAPEEQNVYSHQRITKFSRSVGSEMSSSADGGSDEGQLFDSYS